MSYELTGTYGDKRIVYKERSRYRYGIVRNHPRTGNLAYFPDTVAMQNPRWLSSKPAVDDTGKGSPIHIESNWWHYIEKINSFRGYKWARSISNMWINLQYVDTPYSTARAESLHCGSNFFCWDADYETPTHVKLVTFDWRMDTTVLNRAYNNWFNQSEFFWKPIAVNGEGDIIKVANALDVYFPLIAEKELWMHKKDIEIFPDGYDYKFYGCDVYDGAEPLLTVVGRTQKFHTAWHFETKSNLPPN
jgi:hypothetical protein